MGLSSRRDKVFPTEFKLDQDRKLRGIKRGATTVPYLQLSLTDYMQIRRPSMERKEKKNQNA